MLSPSSPAQLLFLCLIVATDAGMLANLNKMIFCVEDNGDPGLSTIDDSKCKAIYFNIHTHSGGLVLNFNFKNKCRHLCLNTCGDIYYDDQFFTQDCVLSTAKFKSIDTLSVDRGNHTDFIATHGYNMFKFSLSAGASLEKLHTFLTLRHIIKTPGPANKCPLNVPQNNTLTNKPCNAATALRSPEAINEHHDYASYTLWDKMLMFFGWLDAAEPPADKNSLRFYDYTNNYR
ncbi:fgf-1 [Hyphantria cunea granulovirus]|uniref:Fgf-1 n=1 Tax=Hyphantria cunea granulovirus TaxID=307448 RepID=A0AAF1D284_9BBAC|nr:fgf-1 [Hyphantria cunea granulovirus]QBQ01618.1 fgf-1 [Hyphantria cunea granulovirus]